MTDVFYEREVASTPDEVADLFSSPSDWLSEAVGVISSRAERMDVRLRARFGNRRVKVTLAKRVCIEVTSVDHRTDGIVVGLRWEAHGYSGLFPVMDAVLQVSRLSSVRSRVVIWGRYDPPLGRAGELIDRYIAHEVAQATTRGFVEAVTRKLVEVPACLVG
jgi:hypothetical protein